MRKISVFLAVIMALSSLSGCGKEENTAVINVEDVYPWNAQELDDSSDVPDWTGPVTELTYWCGHGTSAGIYEKMENDVVTPELERVTGIKFNNDDRVDNGGQSFDVKLSMLLASNDLPNVVRNPGSLPKLVEADVLYDLKPYIEKYCPNVVKKYPQICFDTIETSGGKEGSLYAIPTGVGGDYLNTVEGFDTKKIGQSPIEYMGFVYVRDDILKKIYPNAKTQDEIEKMYLEKGEFTEEDILDVPIKSYDDFVGFLRKIKALNIKEGGKTVYPTYAFTGTDNWSVMQCMWTVLDGRGSNYNYMFTYWDKEADKVELALKQDFFKNSLSVWNGLVREDIVSPDSLIDPNDTFKEKLNSGLYAVTSSMDVPDENALKTAGKNFRYRKVYLDIPMNTNKFVPLRQSSFGTENIAVFKTTSESQLIQLLRYIDFSVSDLGEKLMSWGPRSAGLWQEIDGKRKFVDKDVEDYVVYGVENSAKSYNLINKNGVYPTGTSMVLPFAYGNIGKFHPTYVYDKEPSASDAKAAFSIGNVRKYDYVYFTVSPDLWNYTDESDTVKQAWSNRVNVENALTKILASSSEENFEQNYNQMLEVLEQCKWNDEMLKDVNAGFERKNADRINDMK